jgi:hypothetical protein
MERAEVAAGERLIEQGDAATVLFFVEAAR